jgi:hypothetical protein
VLTDRDRQLLQELTDSNNRAAATLRRVDSQLVFQTETLSKLIHEMAELIVQLRVTYQEMAEQAGRRKR